MPTHLRTFIATGLVCLIAINGMVEAVGSFLVCLHAQDSEASEIVDWGYDCCHALTGADLPECGDCEDITLESVDFLAIRTHDQWDGWGVAVTQEPLRVEPILGGGRESRASVKARAPPAVAGICLMVAQTVVLRI